MPCTATGVAVFTLESAGPLAMIASSPARPSDKIRLGRDPAGDVVVEV
jgi:hypothetical protein